MRLLAATAIAALIASLPSFGQTPPSNPIPPKRMAVHRRVNNLEQNEQSYGGRPVVHIVHACSCAGEQVMRSRD